RSPLTQVLTESFSLEVFHHEVMKVEGIILVDVQHPDDVMVAEPGHHSCLAVKAGNHFLVIHQIRREYLERQDGVQGGMGHFVYHSHTAPPKLGDDLVFSRNNQRHGCYYRVESELASPVSNAL